MAPKLITTINEVKTQVPVNMTSDYDVISPFLANAEAMYVTRLIGQEQFDALAEAYSVDMEAGANKNAVIACQKVIANLGYFFAVPVLSVSIGTTGIQVFSNDNTKQAFQWQVTDLKAALTELGFTGIEEMLALLESDPETFAPYAASSQLQTQKSCLITTAADFNNYFEISSSRFVFQSINYLMKRVEQQNVVKVLGADFFQSLKGPDLSDKELTLANTYLKPGIALLTVAKAIVERVCALKDGQITYNLKGRTDNMNESQALSAQQIAAASDQLVTDGAMFLQDGMQYILDNATDFPGFVAPVARRRFRVTNNPWKGVFGI